MILVLGSTGNVGRHVVAGLLAAGEKVRAFTRDPARAAASGFGGEVQVVTGDLGEPDTVLAALTGVDRVFVATSPDALAHEVAVAGAVRRSGVSRVVKLSSVAANPPVNDAYGRAHATGEQAFIEADVEWTALRPAGYMSNVLQWKRSIASQGKVFQPYGKVERAVIAPADVAAVAVTCLTNDGHHGKAYQLTGPQSLTAPEQTAMIAAALGRQVEFVDADPEQARNGMVNAGMPADLVDGLLASMAELGPLRGGTPTSAVRDLTGREPVTFDAWLKLHLTDLSG
jgi:uncharacterized protein YbjT (DUF2867 family)